MLQLRLHGEDMKTQIKTIQKYTPQILSALFLSSVSVGLYAQATFLIWPIYPKIESNEKATAVWLENTGKTDAMVQIRVFKWDQKENKDSYQDQSEIIPSPPVVKIKAGDKNMLRLTRTIAPPPNSEQAYRVIIDELPIKLDNEQQTDNSTVSFQMRYSIPLFSYGTGLGSGLNLQTTKINEKNPLAKPILTYSLEKNAVDQHILRIQNVGAKFARISTLGTTADLNTTASIPIQVGYVLAQSSMQFILDTQSYAKINQSSVLYATDSSGISQNIIEIKKTSQAQ